MTRVAAAVLFCLALGGCDQLTHGFKQAVGPPHTLKNKNGTLSLTVPGSWVVDTLNAGSELQASNRREELYVVVISEPKEGLTEIDLDRFSEITRNNQLKGMKGASAKGPERRTIRGLPDIQYELRGSVDAAEMVMIHAAIEGKTQYHQLMVWTLKRKWEQQKATLQAVIDSLAEADAVEIQPAP